MFTSLLLAETRAAAISRSFSFRETALSWHAIVAGLVVLALVLVLVRAWQMAKTGDKQSRPGALFMRIAEQLKLHWTDSWLLWRIARQQNLPSALTLLLSRNTLLTHAEGYAARMSARRRDRVLRHANRLAQTLFG